ncbi:tetratricopeptide repeat protein [Pseudanabaena sp. FACHB-1998]|uniref:O-linked N-acetylglucosamine transferase, SPINDLY family protein n=1 Tax=Pseudanabaena sp. FACHB-1998 TaxID=2692858 RepID=UPI001680EB3F|nr:tetratricopeptide repeat protein [Pseudanabaena sp. FACHB-1998]MBD2177405.1 tetratricopeptide repeat protein [Pseudanabaena sp. FACHB-1998]
MKAYHQLIQGNYSQAIQLYEQEISKKPDRMDNYGYLGLTLLLQKREAEAHIIWSSVIDSLEDVESWILTLEKILNSEANRFTTQSDLAIALLIRQHLNEVCPDSIGNLSALIQISLDQTLGIIPDEYIYQLIEILQQHDGNFSDKEIFALKSLLQTVITDTPKKKVDNSSATDQEIKELQKICTIDFNVHVPYEFLDFLETKLDLEISLIKLVLEKVELDLKNEIVFSILKATYPIPLQIQSVYIRACLGVLPDSILLLKALSSTYQNIQLNLEAAKIAKSLAQKSNNDLGKMAAYYAVTRSYLNSGVKWHDAYNAYAQYKTLANIMLERQEPIDDLNELFYLATNAIFSNYLIENTKDNHDFFGKLGTYYQREIRKQLGTFSSSFQASRLVNKSRKLRIGYISDCIRRHSVGWLSRWLLTNHDLEKYDIFVYSINPTEDHIHYAIKNSVTHFHSLVIDDESRVLGVRLVAEQIQNDAIDILIELDMLTSINVLAVLALKPAPIQVSWLGSDESGIPAIDYFIADPYVLPPQAESYYNAQIWRLPRTYIAIEGFEVGVSNLKREDLGIPNDAIVYLCVQECHKLNPDFLRLQMQILSQVPNSFLLYKNKAKESDFKPYISEIATSEGISPERIRLLSKTPTEEVHRANLMIADVILDTYFYNGATTNLEALWLEIPIVTKAGEMFTARNGFALMTNAGISEGIAWTDEEYVEWGVKLGKDKNLRQQISQKIKNAKRTAPLWNSKQFAREIENAYSEMWNRYINREVSKLEMLPEKWESVIEAEENNYRGIALAQTGDLNSAIIHLQRAINLDPAYIDAYYNMGIALNQMGYLDRAVDNLQKAIALNPEHSNSIYNLGVIMMKRHKVEDAIECFLKVIEISPFDLDTYLALGSAYLEINSIEKAAKSYRNALRINPKSASAHCSYAVALSARGKFLEAISHLQKAIDLSPDMALAYCNMGCTLAKFKDRLSEAIYYFQAAIKLDPSLGEAYCYLIDILNTPDSPIGRDLPLQKNLVENFMRYSQDDRVRALSNYISVYCKAGLGYLVEELVIELEDYIYNNSDNLTKAEIACIYYQSAFYIVSLRDNLKLNSKLFKLIGSLYFEKFIKPANVLWRKTRKNIFEIDYQNNITISGFRESLQSHQLRIGIVSSGFKRHSVGWCSLDSIKELSKLTPHIFLYSLDKINPDERTKKFIECAEAFYFSEIDKLENDRINSDFSSSSNVLDTNSTLEQMYRDKLDVLIDLDSITIPANIEAICFHSESTICVTWLGFDAPYITSNNYFLGDWYTHPKDVETFYTEQILRLPDSHMAVSGFDAVEIDRDLYRNSLNISPEQVVYLYSAPPRKFNLESANSHIKILKRVPDSILLIRCDGEIESIRAIYLEICQSLLVDFDRIRTVFPAETEEEHRSIYSLADIYLDAYPYNGGTHNLESLWFNLPVVTRKGEQSFSRMGYSFLQSLGINEGIANNWEDYIEWGVKYGIDPLLRNSIKEKLISSKYTESLAPLWNPQKLASDMYNLLNTLVAEKKIK